MDEKKYKLNLHTAALSLPAEHAEKLLSLGDGEAALLYLYILRSGGSLDETEYRKHCINCPDIIVQY